MGHLSADNWTTLGLRNMAIAREASALAMGGRVEHWGSVRACDARSACPIANNVALMRPLAEADVAGVTDRLDAFFGAQAGGSWVLWTGQPTPDLGNAGYSFWGEPPLMVRAPGGCPPPIPPELRVVEAHDAATVQAFESVLVDGNPLPWLQPYRPGALFDSRVLGGPLRLFVGSVDDRPVSVSMACTDGQIVGVYAVATLPEARGRGYGAALTWYASAVDPGLPAILQSSEIGLSVYERLGYSIVAPLSLWERARPGSPTV